MASTSAKGSSAKAPSVLSLEDQFVFYSSYHTNPINKAIHFVCIWPIFWTGLALFASIGAIAIPPEIAEYLPLKPEAWNLHLGTPIALTYVVVYLGGGLVWCFSYVGWSG